MGIGAEIRTFGTRCAERHQLGVALTQAIDAVYKCRARWDAVQKNRPEELSERFSALEAARTVLDAARHKYNEHVESHGCMGSQASATAAGL